jgi:hypothetical protein
VVRRDEQFPVAVSVVISLVIIVIIASVMVISTRQIMGAVVPDSSLVDGWHERISDRAVSSGFFNINQEIAYTYAVDDVIFPASLLVQTTKSLVLPSEAQLLTQAISRYLPSLQDRFLINQTASVQGMRELKNGHHTHYIIYPGSINASDGVDEVRCIIEVWNCGLSKTSIICVGVAQMTNDSVPPLNQSNLDHWQRIISDPVGSFGDQYRHDDALIYSIRCH